MGGDHGRQLGRLDPVDPLHRRVGPGQPAGLGPVLARPDHQRPHPRGVREQAERPADGRGSLQRGEQPEERHPQDVRVGARAGRRPGGEPGGRRTDRHHQRPVGQLGRHQLGVLGAVEQDQVGAAQGPAVQRVQQPHLHRAGQPPVDGGVGGEDEVVEHDRGPPEQQPGQLNVEVAEIADQHGLRHLSPVGPPPADREQHPAAGQPERAGRQPPRLAQHRHPVGGVESQRDVHLDDVVATGA